MKDREVKKLIGEEEKRSGRVINLIASENFVSEDVHHALGSVFSNKYAEGYPHKRYYGGNQVVDKLEELAQSRALKLFKLSAKKWSVNVQPLSGSPANLAVLSALLPIAESGAKSEKGRIMGMKLAHGGHLTHGHTVSMTGKLWQQIPYGVAKDSERIDYDELLQIAKKEKPHVIIAGFTAYSRKVDWKKFRMIADAVGAYLFVDMSHVAGLVAGGAYPSPFPYADVVTTTTHKTLRGPRGAMIFSRRDARELPLKIDKAVFPGLQGGPHEHTIAAIAVALGEAMDKKFKIYAAQTVKNARALAHQLAKLGWRIISGGTDSHLFLVDVFARGISGKIASEKLEAAGIIVNMNAIPFDERKPTDPSGIRIGTAAMTTLGKKERDMILIATKINHILRAK